MVVKIKKNRYDIPLLPIFLFCLSFVVLLMTLSPYFAPIKKRALFPARPTPTPARPVEKLETSNWKTYENIEYNYKINYPKDFKVTEKNNNIIISPIKPTPTEIPIVESIDQNLNINIFEISQNKLDLENVPKLLCQNFFNPDYSCDNSEPEQYSSDIYRFSFPDMMTNNYYVIINSQKDKALIISQNFGSIQKQSILFKQILSTLKFTP